MKSGIQYNADLSVKSAVESGLEYVELNIDDIDKLEVVKAAGGKISGICVEVIKLLSGNNEKEILSDSARLTLKKALSYVRNNISSYIVLDTEGVNSASVIEQLISESSEFLINSQVSIYIENGYKYSNGRYYHNDYSDGRKLKELVIKLNMLCPGVDWKICINVGHTNLLGINIRDMVRVCSGYIGLVHINDNNSYEDQHQMPYTFTTGRGELSTDWNRFIGVLYKEKYSGYMIFDNKDTFARTPVELHTAMLELMCACVYEWEDNCFEIEKYLEQNGKKLILFGSGRMTETYMDYWGNKYKPYYLVDNNQDRWGQQLMGVPIKSPQEILNIPPEQRNVWICNLNYEIVGTQLDNMGIEYRCYRDLYFI